MTCVSKRGVWKCVYVNWLAVGRVTAELVLFFVSNKNPSLHLDVLTWVRNLRVDDAECACVCACAIGDA